MGRREGSDIWLGDALRLRRELGLDAEATSEMLGLLGLRPAETAAQETPKAPAPGEPGPGPTKPAPEQEPRPPTSPVDEGIGAAQSRLVFSTLERTETRSASASPPAWFTSQRPVAPASVPHTRVPRPLFSRLQRRSILSYAIGREVAEGPLDVEAIARTLALGRPLRHVPRQPRRTLRYGVEVLVDRARWMEPFYRDQDGMLDYLETLLPRERVHVRQISGDPPAGRTVRSAEAASVHAYAGVLALTDLGVGYRPGLDAPPSTREWLRFARDARNNDRSLAVLLPYHRARWPERLRRSMAILHWSERTTAGQARRLRRGGRPELPPRRREREEAHARELARALSTAVRIDAWMLREARLQLVPQSDPSTEADLWLSGLIASRGPSGVVLKPHVMEELRRELAELDPAFVSKALALIARAHAHYPETTRIEEQLGAMAVSGGFDADRIDRLLRPALKALHDPQAEGARSSDVARWTAHAWDRLPPEVRESDTARQLALAAAFKLGESEWMQKPGEPSPLPSESAWLLPQTPDEDVLYGIELRYFDDGEIDLVVSEPGEETSARHVIRAPKTQPALLQVHAGDADDETTHALALQPGATWPVGFVRRDRSIAVRLQTLRGDAYRLSLASTLEVATACLLEVTENADDPQSPRSIGVYLGAGNVIATGRLQDRSIVSIRTGPPHRTFQARAYFGLAEGQYQTSGGGWRLLRLMERHEEGYASGLVALDLDATPADQNATSDNDSTTAFFPSSGGLLEMQARIVGPRRIVFDGEPPREGALLFYRDGAEGPSLVLPFVVNPAMQGSGAVPDPPQYRAAPLRELLRQAREHLSRNWRLYISHSGDQQRTAEMVSTLLRRRFGEERVLFAPKESFTLRERVLGCDAVLLLGQPTSDVVFNELAHAQSARIPVLWVLSTASQASVPLPIPPLLENAQAIRISGPFDEKSASEIAEQIARWTPETGFTSEPQAPALEPRAAPAIAERQTRGFRAELLSRIDNTADATNLYRCALLEPFDLKPFVPPSGTEPILVLIHGDGGSGRGSFGNLWDASNDSYRTRLHARYGERVLSFEYRSVTRGFIDNALELAQRLPAGATLDLLTLGGGGIIGELLCRGQRIDSPEPFDERDIALLREGGLDDVESSLRMLSSLLLEKRFRVQRFVRIACPVRGSTMWKELAATPAAVLRSVGAVLFPIRPLTKVLSVGAEILLRNFQDEKVAPGLTQIAPSSAVIRLVNREELRYSGELAIVAGVHQSLGLKAKLLGLAYRMVIKGPADLIVTLESNFGGARRDSGAYRYVDTGPEVTHFNYFRNQRSVDRVVNALLEGAEPAGFERLDADANVNAQ